MTYDLAPRHARAAERMRSPWLAADSRDAAARVLTEAPIGAVPAELLVEARTRLEPRPEPTPDTWLRP